MLLLSFLPPILWCWCWSVFPRCPPAAVPEVRIEPCQTTSLNAFLPWKGMLYVGKALDNTSYTRTTLPFRCTCHCSGAEVRSTLHAERWVFESWGPSRCPIRIKLEFSLLICQRRHTRMICLIVLSKRSRDSFPFHENVGWTRWRRGSRDSMTQTRRLP